jgi:16S rRNA (cytosine1402-N4)-methyltransferase
MNLSYHQSVMPNEIMSFFKKPAGKIFVDATAGGGGHLRLLAMAAGEKGKVFGFDKDPRAHEDDAALSVAKQFKTSVKLFHRSFSSVKETLKSEGIEKIDGIICDLGVSSHQLDNKSRGFSFQAEAPLDMRMDQNSGISAYEWLEKNSEEEIANVLYQLGDERKSRAIARRIKKSWPIENSTLALAKIVVSAVKQKTWSKIHPATRTFQAIRMAVNHEIDELRCLLDDIPDLLDINGIAIFLSFHSIEDRLIKNAFKDLAKRNASPFFHILTKKPMTASQLELAINRRARSAKLRALMRIA